jgi:hypothetical protein
MRIRVSDPALLPELVEFLERREYTPAIMEQIGDAELIVSLLGSYSPDHANAADADHPSLGSQPIGPCGRDPGLKRRKRTVEPEATLPCRQRGERVPATPDLPTIIRDSCRTTK